MKPQISLALTLVSLFAATQASANFTSHGQSLMQLGKCAAPLADLVYYSPEQMKVIEQNKAAEDFLYSVTVETPVIFSPAYDLAFDRTLNELRINRAALGEQFSKDKSPTAVRDLSRRVWKTMTEMYPPLDPKFNLTAEGLASAVNETDKRTGFLSFVRPRTPKLNVWQYQTLATKIAEIENNPVKKEWVLLALDGTVTSYYELIELRFKTFQSSGRFSDDPQALDGLLSKLKAKRAFTGADKYLTLALYGGAATAFIQALSADNATAAAAKVAMGFAALPALKFVMQGIRYVVDRFKIRAIQQEQTPVESRSARKLKNKVIGNAIKNVVQPLPSQKQNLRI